MPGPIRRIEVFTGAGRRRNWSGEEKAAIIAESYGAGETVCRVARRHGLTAQQLFTWQRLARRSALALPSMFVLAVVETTEPEPPATSKPPRRKRRRSKTVGSSSRLAGRSANWRTRHDSNVRPLPSEGSALSS
jgi:transposase